MDPAGLVSAPFLSYPTFALGDIEALSDSDVWAVGSEEIAGYDPDSRRPIIQPLILHWDGRQWSRFAVQAPDVDLAAVSGSSRSNVWAVGWNGQVGGTAAVRWDGVKWHRTPTPRGRSLDDVVTIGPSEAWAVGETASGGPLIARWNGRSWKLVPAPVKGYHPAAVDASSPSNVWTVGSVSGERAIAARWNGTRWVLPRLPRPPHPFSWLSDVSVVSSSDAWAVGSSVTTMDPKEEDGTISGYTLRWGATGWQRDPASSKLGLKQVVGVQAHSATDAWIWGFGRAGIAHWDGRGWAKEPVVPFAGRTDAGIGALDTSSSGTLWVLGSYFRPKAQIIPNVVGRYSCRD